VPCHIYYLVRVASVLVMLTVAALWRGQESGHEQTGRRLHLHVCVFLHWLARNGCPHCPIPLSHLPKELTSLFDDDPDFVLALVAGCAGMAVLLPILRWQARDSLMSSEQYPRKRWVEKAFTPSEKKLLNDMSLAGRGDVLVLLVVSYADAQNSCLMSSAVREALQETTRKQL